MMLPPDLKAAALKRARALKVSLGELIRLSLQEQLEKPLTESSRKDPFLFDTAVFEEKTPRDLATAHDLYLGKEKP